MNNRALLVFFASCILHSILAVQGTAQQLTDINRTPVAPRIDGTYYYQGYDAPGDRYVYVSSSNIYYYVDSSGFSTVGGTAALGASATPYRVIVSGTVSDFVFYNNNANNYTHTEVTGTGGMVITATDYSVRSGTWFASDITLKLSTGDASGLWIEGVSGAFSASSVYDLTVTGSTVVSGTSARVIYPNQPVVFSGTNINIISDVANNSSRQAVSIRNGGAVFLYGGTISKTVNASGAGSETIYLVGNQEALGTSAHFYGEDLTIISDGNGLETFQMGNGHTTVELYSSTITARTGGGPNTQVIRLNDQQGQGGSHFYGEDITINNYQGRVFAFGYGENSITLKNSTITSSGTAGAVFRWITSEGTGGGAGGNEAMADGFVCRVDLVNTNITTTADYTPIYAQTGRLGWSTVTSSTFITTGNGSPILRLLGANDAHDETKFTGIFTNVFFEAQNSSAIDLDMYLKDTANYGEDGGGINKEVTTLITTTWDLVFISSTLSGTTALRVATAGLPTSPYSNDTRLSAFDSTIIGRIEMDAGSTATGRYETTGANLTVLGRNSHFIGGFHMAGDTVARKYHQATLDLSNSTWEGDISADNRGAFLAKFKNTPMTGNIILSGSVVTYLDFVNSPIEGGISLDGTATLINNPGLDVDNRRATIHNTPISGGINIAGASHIDLIFEGSESVVSGGITAAGSATGVFRFEKNSSINGGVTVSGSSSVTIVLSDANQLTGDLFINDRARLALATFAGTPIRLDRSIALEGIWGITGKTTLAGLLEITDPLGTISIDNAAPDVLTLSGGITGNGRLDIVSISSGALGAAQIRVIHDPTGSFASDTLILARSVEYGLAAYNLENRPDGAYLVGGLANGSFGSGGAAVFNSQALMVEDWLASLIPVNNRLSELRQNNAAFLGGSSTGAPARGDAGSLWAQVRGDITQVDTGSDALDFDSYTIGIIVGLDARWDFETSSISSGAFVDTARTDRDFIAAAEGTSDSIGGGAYVHYQHRLGIFASAIARFDTYETTLDTHSPNNALKADYNSQALGGAIDIGWRFELFNSGWWCEPAYQIALASFPGVSYRTHSTKRDNNIYVATTDANATQHFLRVAFGKALGRRVSLHGSLAVATVSASGGDFDAHTDSEILLKRANFTLAGDRLEASIGMRCKIAQDGCLAINATYINADDYQRPCVFSIGYSHAW